MSNVSDTKLTSKYEDIHKRLADARTMAKKYEQRMNIAACAYATIEEHIEKIRFAADEDTDFTNEIEEMAKLEETRGSNNRRYTMYQEQVNNLYKELNQLDTKGYDPEDCQQDNGSNNKLVMKTKLTPTSVMNKDTSASLAIIFPKGFNVNKSLDLSSDLVKLESAIESHNFGLSIEQKSKMCMQYMIALDFKNSQSTNETILLMIKEEVMYEDAKEILLQLWARSLDGNRLRSIFQSLTFDAATTSIEAFEKRWRQMDKLCTERGDASNHDTSSHLRVQFLKCFSERGKSILSKFTNEIRLYDYNEYEDCKEDNMESLRNAANWQIKTEQKPISHIIRYMKNLRHANTEEFTKNFTIHKKKEVDESDDIAGKASATKKTNQDNQQKHNHTGNPTDWCDFHSRKGSPARHTNEQCDKQNKKTQLLLTHENPEITENEKEKGKGSDFEKRKAAVDFISKETCGRL
jgi:hypothetical protein